MAILAHIIMSPIGSSSTTLRLAGPGTVVRIVAVPGGFFVFCRLLVIVRSFGPNLLLRTSTLERCSKELPGVAFQPGSSFAVCG